MTFSHCGNIWYLRSAVQLQYITKVRYKIKRKWIPIIFHWVFWKHQNFHAKHSWKFWCFQHTRWNIFGIHLNKVNILYVFFLTAYFTYLNLSIVVTALFIFFVTPVSVGVSLINMGNLCRTKIKNTIVVVVLS